MARGRVTAAYDSWLAVPFCLVLLVVGPSTALSQCYFTAFRVRSLSVSSKPAMSFPMSCSFLSAEIKKEYGMCHNKRCSFFFIVLMSGTTKSINVAFWFICKGFLHRKIHWRDFYFIKKVITRPAHGVWGTGMCSDRGREICHFDSI